MHKQNKGQLNDMLVELICVTNSRTSYIHDRIAQITIVHIAKRPCIIQFNGINEMLNTK